MLLDDDFITEQLMLGYTIPELAEMWDISYTVLNNNYSFNKKKFKYIVERIEITGKQEPYYHNEWQYGNIPTYKFKELSKAEIEFYNEYLKINN
tara:strand:- start:704 stop:985 length:282 start_codon:yes stop_codon:yes gene_type:complete